ncbi:MAG: hypothetical protein IKZ58_06415 [Selenomonadaceae bacterium]|nr:hypothetical protein [Selenomonadaceae bacterium]
MGKKFKERRTAKEKILISLPPASTDNCIIVWSFDKVDRNGIFSFDLSRKDLDIENLFQKILEFSTMKWCELFPTDKRKSRHHTLSKESLSKQALERIEVLKLDEDTDSIFSLALNNKARLIGIRNGAVFQVIWYDANHEFSISNKKHT